MNEAMVVGFIVIAVPLVALALVTWLLHYFIALKSPPTQRAAWTVGIAYPIVLALCASAVPEEYWWEAPLAGVPGALLAFWWWRMDFREAWVDASKDVPEGVKLANDDWRIGLIFVAGLIGFLALRVVLRLIARGQF
jgi:hypothetical protein